MNKDSRRFIAVVDSFCFDARKYLVDFSYDFVLATGFPGSKRYYMKNLNTNTFDPSEIVVFLDGTMVCIENPKQVIKPFFCFELNCEPELGLLIKSY